MIIDPNFIKNNMIIALNNNKIIIFVILKRHQ